MASNELTRTQAREALLAEGYDDDSAAKIVSIVAPVWERQVESKARMLALRNTTGKGNAR